jgi:type IV pilus assembly protein PilW
MNRLKKLSSSARTQAGFSIIELLVGVAIGLVLLVAVVTVFIQSRSTGRALEDSQSVQEGARFALDRVSFALRMTKNAGCIRAVDKAIGLKAKATAATDDYATFFTSQVISQAGALEKLLGTGAFIRAFNEGAGFTPANAAGRTLALNGASAGMNAAPDVLYVAGATPDFQHLNAPMVAVNDGTITTVNRLTSGASTNTRLMIISDCARGEIFNGTPTAATAVISYDTVSNLSADFRKAYGANSSVSLLEARNYFVAKSNVAAEFARDGWVLYEQKLESAPGGAYQRFAPPQPVVSRVTRFNVEFGVDTNSDGKVDFYKKPSGITDWGSALTARVTIGIQGSEANAVAVASGFSGRVEQVFTSQVELRN